MRTRYPIHRVRAMLKVLDLFSGIGGFSLGLERTGGFETVAFCEIEEYSQKVLAKNWPGVPIYNDVRELTRDKLYEEGITEVSVLTGGYPCQPFSLAGNRRGENDDRHLWPEVARLIQEINPDWCIFENVFGHISLGLDQVLSDLEGLNYTAEVFVIPACAVGASHRRDRVWIIAYPNSGSIQKCFKKPGIPSEKGRSFDEYDFLPGITRPARWESPPASFRASDGLPGWVDRVRALGNAVVPQIPEMIGRAILQHEAQR